MQKTLGNQRNSGDNRGASFEAGRGGVEAPNAALTTDAGEGIDMADSDSTTGRAPAFQFYPKDFLSDERVRLMSLAERGAYITLICQCWSEGTIPADVAKMAKVIGTPEAPFRKLWPAIATCFKPATNDATRLVHPRLERELKKQRAFRRRQADNGRKGGRPPHVGKPNPNPSLSTRANQSPSSDLVLSGSESGSQTHVSERVRAFPPREKGPSEVSDDIAERAGRFCERYAELYAKHRKGARYLGKPTLDFQEALQLVATWPDARLDQIATVFLTTDHEFAEKGSRTMAQFRSLASWCDSRLVEAGIA